MPFILPSKKEGETLSSFRVGDHHAILSGKDKLCSSNKLFPKFQLFNKIIVYIQLLLPKNFDKGLCSTYSFIE